MRSFRVVLAGMMVAGALVAFHSAANAQGAIITHTSGLVRLGVNDFGALNFSGVGVRYLKPGTGGFEYTNDGCTCEGWGAADKTSGVTGSQNTAVEGVLGLSLISFSSTGSEATSVVETTAVNPVRLKTTQFYHPSTSGNLYQVDVTIENTGTGAATDLIYRRVMDWDIEPTPFSEFVTLKGALTGKLIYSSDNGFNFGDPLQDRGFVGGTSSSTINVDFTHLGPTDHGAQFDFGFGALAPGEKVDFTIFYGGADSEKEALAALASVGAEAIYSLGEPNDGFPPGDANYSVSIFGFKGVGAPPVGGVPEPGTWAMLGGSLIGLGVLRFRRKS